jgi:hypothetical protein
MHRVVLQAGQDGKFSHVVLIMRDTRVGASMGHVLVTRAFLEALRCCCANTAEKHREVEKEMRSKDKAYAMLYAASPVMSVSMICIRKARCITLLSVAQRNIDILP